MQQSIIVRFLGQHAIRQSKSRKRDCQENAPIKILSIYSRQNLSCTVITKPGTWLDQAFLKSCSYNCNSWCRHSTIHYEVTLPFKASTIAQFKVPTVRGLVHPNPLQPFNGGIHNTACLVMYRRYFKLITVMVTVIEESNPLFHIIIRAPSTTFINAHLA